MSWHLTEPYDGGSISGSPYDQVKIVDLHWIGERSRMIVTVEYGTTIDGQWVASIAPEGKPTIFVVDDEPTIDGEADEEYAAMMAANQAVYQAVKDATYAWFASAAGKQRLDPGSVV